MIIYDNPRSCILLYYFNVGIKCNYELDNPAVITLKTKDWKGYEGRIGESRFNFEKKKKENWHLVLRMKEKHPLTENRYRYI